MAFALVKSKSALIPLAAGAVHDFSVSTSIASVRMTNTGAQPVAFTLWFDYDGTAMGDVDLVAKTVQLDGYQSIVLDGSPWNFDPSSRISGSATINNVVSCHITPATI